MYQIDEEKLDRVKAAYNAIMESHAVNVVRNVTDICDLMRAVASLLGRRFD